MSLNALKARLSWLVFISAFLTPTLSLGSQSVIQRRPIPISVCQPMYADGPQMCIKARDTTRLGNRIPILLTSGWGLNWSGPPMPEMWDNFVNYTATVSWVAEKFKFYNVTYYSNLISVSDIGQILAELVDQMDVLDPNFAKQKFFLMGHSMGNLVDLSFMVETKLQGGRGMKGGDRVLHLTALAAPFQGTPFANGPSRNVNAGPLIGPVLDFVDWLIFKDVPWSAYNRYDLHLDSYLNSLLIHLDYDRFPEDSNIWLDRLNTKNTYQHKISSYGGSIHVWDDWDDGCTALARLGNISMSDLLDCSALLANRLYGLWNDGIVPIHSTFFTDCADCIHETLFGYNHNQMVQGLTPNDSYLFGAILGELSDFVSVGDSRFSPVVVMGDSYSEAFHNLRGWSDVGWDPNQGSYRKQLDDDLHLDSVDLFVPKVGVPYTLSFKRAENSCNKDSFFVYLQSGNIDTPLEEVITGEGYQCSASQGSATYRTTIWSGYIKRNRISIGFLDATSDGSGSKPMYYVRLDPA